MDRFSLPILDYWHRIFSDGAIIASGDAFSISVNATLGHARRAMILEYADGQTRAAIAPAIARQLAIDDAQDISVADLRHRLTDAGAALHDPDFLFYLPAEQPLQRRSTRATECRRLSEADREAFALFQAAATGEDLEDAYVELDHWAVFGIFEGEYLASAASTYPWGDAPIADIGVLTLPAFRGRGHACAIVETISQFARSQGYEPQYRCQLTNAASVALAKASGFMLFGKWEVSTGTLDDDSD